MYGIPYMYLSFYIEIYFEVPNSKFSLETSVSEDVVFKLGSFVPKVKLTCPSSVFKDLFAVQLARCEGPWGMIHRHLRKVGAKYCEVIPPNI